MSFDWKGSRSTRVNVVSWPTSENLGEGRERARWDLETLEEAPAQELERDVSFLAGQDSQDAMHVEFEASGPKILTMICDYDSSLPEPMRIEAVSVLWRSIDERVARLWLIGSVPRVRYPAFMRQRRDLVRILPVGLQLNWLALSLVRLEPLVAVLAGKTSDFQRLAEKISNDGGERDVLRAVINNISDLEGLVGGNPVRRRISASQGKADLGNLLLELGGVLIDVRKRSDLDSIAGCTERVFDALHLVDSEYGRQVESGLAKLEDRSWWRDARKLADGGAGALAAAAMEASSCAERVRSTCVEVDLRSQFLNVGNGDR
ncbi:hypothetical protein [Amycolatopsis sp. cmx-4-83]|uniref:hypothetical protein n=1 Tax=Amycolatopsis sp. cmx-4-83 TaxID=2790940 RepID=UPI00397ADCBD